MKKITTWSGALIVIHTIIWYTQILWLNLQWYEGKKPDSITLLKYQNLSNIHTLFTLRLYVILVVDILAV